MPFKIIETIENKRRLITTVPTLWEENGDLYWPKRNAFHLKKLEKSKPNKDEWTRLTCLVLRDNILNYKAAEQQVALMSDATDTDEKENERPRKNTKNTLNLNDLAMECMQSNEISEEASMVAAEDVSSAVVAKNSSTVVAAEDVSSANVGKTSSTVVAAETTSPVITMEDSSSFMLIGSNVLIPTEETNFLMPDLSQDITNNPTDSQNILLQPDDNLLLTDTSQHLDPELTESQTIITGSTEVPQQIGYLIEIMSAIQDNQKVLFDNQQNIIKGIALLNTKLEEFVMRSQEQSQEQHDKRLLKMITNIDELKAFEEQLNDPLIEAQYLKELSSSCSDKKTGDNNAYVLVDLIFDRKFMTHCSWGGGTKGEPKHCFKAYTKTFDFFFKAVQHDKKFTKPNCEDFFKKVMRHFLKRSAAKRVRNSTTKNKKVKTSAAVNKRQETAV